MPNTCTDVMIHIVEELDDASINAIERELSSVDGVVSACVNEKARHLILVDYDPANIHASDLLHKVEHRGLHAQLVGL
ncbi:heavy metal-associated domain-containing protein [endosymbiont of Ridgeia piscesae]|uniref:HMA domain-containing protein n=1 Tax=endosymbiont of Ridgeia piscesae TaxID=54398 RepID=A0A0T5YTH1_9GAMM|nr:heavy metal-associated domain-containing protein [endosymbiont of Ridgeia piscesae]KRT53786.1 hypothetical protein Ga0074115_101121 [endosymbiont of Ridgeia piscesae]KRT59480.1 hypothetical protein Ga0076813_15503 [endosymbiont of Ridgeia piscesae]